MQPPVPAIETVLGEPSRHDIYLSPHSDDACFSLGALARARGKGTLLTVFTTSFYRVPEGARDAGATRATTNRRMAEDAAFALACGLEPRWLALHDAMAREQRPFDAALAVPVAMRVAKEVLGQLVAPTVGRSVGPRPWLFCPAGIGGHVDHLAVALIVTNRLDRLSHLYRIAFYEDLHYASKAAVRTQGVKRLREFVRGRGLLRCALPLEDAKAQAAKMSLVAMYESQLTPQLQSIAPFVPATCEEASPHEAVWVLQGDEHQRPG